MKWIINSTYTNSSKLPEFDYLNPEAAGEAQTFHKSLPGYMATPLVLLKELAQKWGLKSIYVKDESKRLGLKAFKVLGASYAIRQILERRIDLEFDKQTQMIKEPQTVNTFATATDGNHGRAVAWVSRYFDQHAIVYMPAGSTENRINAIINEGAQVSITDYSYDKTAEIIAEQAITKGWILVQDSSWDKYIEIPKRIMQGYLTMALEIECKLHNEQLELPTHVFLQAGVGSFPAAIVNYWQKTLNDKCPIFIIIESDQADCFYKSIESQRMQILDGALNTVMAGLACGKPSLLAWNILRNQAHCFLSCPDQLAVNGLRIFNNPIPGDAQIQSGESGSISIGALNYVMNNKNSKELRAALRFDGNSRVLCFNTEGITNQVKAADDTGK